MFLEPIVVDLAVLAAVIFAFGLVSRRLEGTILTAPIVFVAAGIVLGPAGLGLVGFELEGHTVLLLGEIALALVLFTDAARVNLSALRQDEGMPLCLLGIGMPLTIALGTAAALSDAYARRVEGMSADAPEKREAAEAPTRVGSVPTNDKKTEKIQ
jgi:NhaP-type Na+/H+ or K+/H+ antiporter